MSAHDEEFASEAALREWLLQERKVNAKLLGEKASLLYQQGTGFITPSSLLNISAEALMKHDEGIGIPLSNELHNKLKQQQIEEPITTNILGQGVLEKLSLAVFYFIDSNRNPIGTGYFVAPTVAISAAHTFKKGDKKLVNVGTPRTGYLGKPHDGKSYQLVVNVVDWENDFVVFVLGEGAEEPAAHLEPAPVDLNAGDECILVAYQIGIHEELRELGKAPSVGVFKGEVVKAHERHFAYSSPSFAGDSGGAIIFRRGQAVGMHTMTVNQAIELRRLQELDQEKATTGDIVEHVNSVEESVASLIQSLNSGSLGISVSSIMEAYRSNQDSKRSAPNDV